jgi:hypothetical protein
LDSVVDRRLVPRVRRRLELEGAVRHVEVLAEAGAERVEHPATVPRRQRLVGHHHVRREDRLPGGDSPRVQVVHAEDAVDAQDVRPHVGQVDAAGRGLQQDVQRLPQQVPGARHDEAADGHRRDDVRRRPAGGQD